MEINEEKLFSVMEKITREQYDNLLEGDILTLYTTYGVEISMYKYHDESMSVYEDDDEEDAPTHCVVQYNGEDIFVVQTNDDSLEFTDIYGL
tara:strand:- start:1241 stop:1516 length:276 start_codon:yes stop_codon:yes gene_type:complete